MRSSNKWKIPAGHWTIKLGRQNGRLLHWPKCSCVSTKTKLWKLLLQPTVRTSSWLWCGPPELFTFSYCAWLWNWLIIYVTKSTLHASWPGALGNWGIMLGDLAPSESSGNSAAALPCHFLGDNGFSEMTGFCSSLSLSLLLKPFIYNEKEQKSWKCFLCCISFSCSKTAGQTDSQVDASLQNQNLRTDLRRVAKRIRKSARKSQKTVNFTHIIG